MLFIYIHFHPDDDLIKFKKKKTNSGRKPRVGRDTVVSSNSTFIDNKESYRIIE